MIDQKSAELCRSSVEEYRRRCAADPMLFLLGLVIPSAHGPCRFNECMAPFQRQTFDGLLPSLAAVRDGKMPPRRRFWIERTKKAAKDSDLAACLLWSLAFAKRPLYLQVGAADRDQAGIVRRRMEDLLHYNSWLKELVSVHQYKIVGSGGLAELEILAADIAGSHGETPDVLVINELSHVTRWEFVENLLDNADGVPMGVVVIATNAGFHGSKAEARRSNASTSPIWTMHVWDRPAPWIGEADLQEAKSRNSPSRFARLWMGRWASGKGDALDEADIARCFRGTGPLSGPEPGWQYVAGLDLGVSHDHSGLAVLGVNQKERRIKLAWMRGWEPRPGGEVDLIEVENACHAAWKTFRLRWLGYDPTEARLMGQQLRRRGVPMVPVSFSSGKNLTSMAESIVQVVEAGILECYDDQDGRLRRDFGKFNILEKPYGYKLEAVSDEYGHADVGTALAICLPQVLAVLGGGLTSLGEDDVIAEFDDKPLTDEEVGELPAELRDIYDAYEEMEKVGGVDRSRRLLDED